MLNKNLIQDFNDRMSLKRWRSVSILLFVVCFAMILYFTSNDKAFKKNTDYIGEITIKGVIRNDEYRNKILRNIATQENIKGLIVNVDSPGGEVVASEIIYNLLTKIKKNKSIVILMGSSAASGGYLISLASDYIIARNTTLTGSIGVILQSFDFVKTAEKLGVGFVNIKSSELKGQPSPFEKLNYNAKIVLQDSLNDIYNYFVEIFAESRKLNIERAKDLASGRTYTGREALERGLIDEIGDRSRAVAYIQADLKNKLKLTEDLEIREIKLQKEEKWSKFIGKKVLNFFSFYESKSLPTPMAL